MKSEDKKLHDISVGEYGWEEAVYTTPSEKAAYIYTVFAYNTRMILKIFSKKWKN